MRENSLSGGASDRWSPVTSRRRYRFLTEASGSLTAGYLIRSIQEEGHVCIASDIDPHCFGSALADDFVLMPRASDPELWQKLEALMVEARVDLVIPSLDETLLGWSERSASLRERLGVHVVVSEPETVAICRDKWRTYEFFRAAGVPTPATSLEQEYPLVKPRFGRGTAGVRVAQGPVDMSGMLSQELLSGVEYTVDVFCDSDARPVYIVPRRRINVRDGKSTAGVVEESESISGWVHTICGRLRFVGPINLQYFVLPDGSVRFVEINPRIAGGMSLGFAATENWIGLIVRNLLDGHPIVARPVRHGLEMRRYYAEVFIPAR
jgi:carbamoyl-phosphate synthase large subunit